MEELRKRLIGETDAEAYQRVCIENAALGEENRRLRAALEGLVTTEPTYWTAAGEMCVYCGGADGHTGGCPWARARVALAGDWRGEGE